MIGLLPIRLRRWLATRCLVVADALARRLYPEMG